jgi:bifunctional enzyme Fae/Hps
MHRAIDQEAERHNWEAIAEIKRMAATSDRKILVAVAGGIRVDTVASALSSGADIVVSGRATTGSKDVKDAAEQFLSELKQTEIDQYRVMTDF